MDFNNLIQTVLIYALPVLFAITVHEAAHGYVARHFGDNTAYMLGRVTLNPVKHIDPIGTILMPVMLYFATSGAFLFGYAKPVPVNRSRFKHPRAMGIIVSALGPISNFLLAVLTILIIVILAKFGFNPHASGIHEAINVFLGIFLQLNLVLFIFNLIPLPPLDGYRIVEDLAPLKARYWMQQHMQWGIFIFLLIVFIRPLRAVTIDPLMYMALELSFHVFRIFQAIIG